MQHKQIQTKKKDIDKQIKGTKKNENEQILLHNSVYKQPTSLEYLH